MCGVSLAVNNCSVSRDPVLPEIVTDDGDSRFILKDGKYRVIRNDCRGFNNLSYTIHLR